MSFRVKAQTHYHVECRRPLPGFRGLALLAQKFPGLERFIPRRKVWDEVFSNLVMTAGKNKLLDATIKTGVTSPVWFIGLVNNASFSAYSVADTMGSHAGWIESSAYSEATRREFTDGTIASGSVDNSAAKAVYSINATVTIRGAFMVDESTKGGTTGTLYGAGDFSVARSVVSGDTLTITVTVSIT